jgi:predicted aconitase with swiveling domain
LYNYKTIEKGSLIVQDDATGSATTVFVVNTIDENKATPTGIFVDNLPYILMVGAPLIIFAGMFVAKRRESAAA